MPYRLSQLAWGINPSSVDTQMINELTAFKNAVDTRPNETGGNSNQNSQLSLKLGEAISALQSGDRIGARNKLWFDVTMFANPWFSASFNYVGSASSGLLSEVTAVRRIPVIMIALEQEIEVQEQSQPTTLTDSELRQLPDSQDFYRVRQRYGYVLAIWGLQLIQRQINTFPDDVGGSSADRQTLVQKAESLIDLVMAGQYAQAIDSTWNDFVPDAIRMLNVNYLSGTWTHHIGYSYLLQQWTSESFSFIGAVDKMVWADLETPLLIMTAEAIIVCINCTRNTKNCLAPR